MKQWQILVILIFSLVNCTIMEQAPKCEQAIQQIKERIFSSWQGLSDNCKFEELMIEISLPKEDFPKRYLGTDNKEVSSIKIDIPGYYRPTISFDGDTVILFDGMVPELNEDLSELLGKLGEPTLQLDWHFGTVIMKQSELVFPNKGITFFLNEDRDKLLHIALYFPGTIENYLEQLRPSFKKRRLPLKK